MRTKMEMVWLSSGGRGGPASAQKVEETMEGDFQFDHLYYSF